MRFNLSVFGNQKLYKKLARLLFCGCLILFLFGGTALILSAQDNSSETSASESETDESKTDEAENSEDSKDKGNAGEETLNLATELKLTASGIPDLTKVLSLLNQAEKEGLSEENLEFCRQLRLSAHTQRGLALGKILMIATEVPENDLKQLKGIALSDLEIAVKDVPDLSIAHYCIGRLHLLGTSPRKSEAKAAFDRAIETAGDDQGTLAEALEYRSDLEIDMQKQLDYIQKIIEIRGDNSKTKLLLAQVKVRFEEYDEAIELLNSIISSEKTADAETADSQSEEPAANSEEDATNETEQQTPEQSFELEMKAAEKKEILLDAQRLLANIYAEQGKDKEALEIFDQLEGSMENQLMFLIEKGQLYILLKQYDKAIEIYDKLGNELGNPAIFSFLKGLAYFEQKDYKKALSAVNAALKKDLNMTDAIRLKAAIQLELKNFKEALQLFDVLLKKDPGSVEIKLQIAFVHSEKGDLKESLNVLDSLLKNDPEADDVLRMKADIYLAFGKFAEAADIYEKLYQKTPDDASLLNNYAWLLATCPDEKLRDGNRALEMAQKSAELTRFKQAHILSTLGAAFAENGDFEKAKEWSSKAVEIAESKQYDKLEDLKKELESYQNGQPWREEPKHKEGENTDSENSDAENSEIEKADTEDEETEESTSENAESAETDKSSVLEELDEDDPIL